MFRSEKLFWRFFISFKIRVFIHLEIHFISDNIYNPAHSKKELMSGSFGSDLFEVKDWIFSLFCVAWNKAQIELLFQWIWKEK